MRALPDWQAQMQATLTRPIDRTVFKVYYLRFKECGNSGTIHEYLSKTRDSAPSPVTIWRAMKRLELLAARFRHQ